MPSASARVAKRIGGRWRVAAHRPILRQPQTPPWAARDALPRGAVCPYSYCFMSRLIAHIDMDAFYASVELLRYPELRGRAVVIGGGRASQPRRRPDGTREFSALRDYVGRGVVTTSTYEARKFGVFSAMGMMKSAVLAPDAVLLPVDFDEYRKYSRLFKGAVREIAPLIEDRGIDEIYADLSELPGVHDDAGRAVGLALKAAVRERTGLTCSIGITPNKLLSKIASELDKPDGLTLLGHAEHRHARLAAGRAQGQRHRPEGGGKARRLRPEHDRRHRRRRSGVPDRALRQELRRLAARGVARPRRAGRRHRERAEVDQPRDHLRARPARGARSRRAGRDPDRALRRARGRPGAQGLRGEDARRETALRRFQDRDARPDPAEPRPRCAAKSAAPPASA